MACQKKSSSFQLLPWKSAYLFIPLEIGFKLLCGEFRLMFQHHLILSTQNEYIFTGMR